jgi:hypothetical protein
MTAARKQDDCSSGDSSCHRQTQLDQIELQVGIANQKLDRLLNVGGILPELETRVTVLEKAREQEQEKRGLLGLPAIGWFVITLAVVLGQADKIAELFKAIIK